MRRNHRMSRGRRGYGSNLFTIIIALILAVAVGYIGTKFIVYPLVLQDKGEVTSLENKSVQESTSSSVEILPVATDNAINPTTGIPQKVIEDKQDIKILRGYALQYGTFTDKAAANNLVQVLAQKGVNVYIYETTSEFRVMGNAYESQDKANLAAEVLKNGGTEVSVVEY